MNLATLPNNVELTNLILQALVRKMIEKNLMSDADVQALLLAAAGRIGMTGGPMTPQAARDLCNEQLIPAFLGTGG